MRNIRLGQLSRPIEVAPYINPNREQEAEKTSQIDYGCGFDEQGRCKMMRKFDPKTMDDRTFGLGKMACCVHCNIAGGYLDSIPADAVTTVKKAWSDETGFWREGIGCTLPRKWRSDTCLGYNCGPTEDGASVGGRSSSIPLWVKIREALNKT